MTKKDYVPMENLGGGPCAGKLTYLEILIHRCNELFNKSNELTLKLEAATKIIHRRMNHGPNTYTIDAVKQLIEDEADIIEKERRDERS